MLLMAYCWKHIPIPDPLDDPKDTIFELVCETKTDSTKSIIGSNYVQVWKEWFIWTGDIEDPPTIKYFNSKTGKKEWENIHKSLKYQIYYNTIINDIYIGITNDGVFGFDLKFATPKIYESKIEDKVNIYPNPNTGEFDIVLQNDNDLIGIENVRIMTQEGDIIFNKDFSGDLNIVSIKLYNQVKGIYLYSMKDSSGVLHTGNLYIE